MMTYHDGFALNNLIPKKQAEFATDAVIARYAKLKEAKLEDIIANAEKKCGIGTFLNRGYTWKGVVRHLLNANLPKNVNTGGGSATATVTATTVTAATATTATASATTDSATSATTATATENHDTYSMVNNLGLKLIDEGNIKEAIVHYQQAVIGFEKIFGREHDYTLCMLSVLEILLKDQEAKI